MSYELKPNTFSAFVNDKNGNEKKPDWTGKINIDGKEKRIAIWKRKSASGIEYLSGTIEEPFKPAEQLQPEQKIEEAVADEIPFNQDR